LTAKNYEAWEVQESDYPGKGTVEEQLTFLLRYAILAPSGPNSQPWKFAISGNIISVFADLQRSLIHVDPDNRTLFMSVGCAIANLVTAGKHFGFSASLNYFPRGLGSDLVAEVKLEPGKGGMSGEDLFSEITKRHTTKDRYENQTVEIGILDDLKRCIDRPGFVLSYLCDKDAKSMMADLVSRAHQTQLAKKEFRQNLGEWLRNNWTGEPDGMPLYTFGVPDAVSLGFPAAFKEFDLSRAVIYRDSGLIHGCSCLAVLTTDQDDRLAWTMCGLLLERLLLKAASYGVRASFFSQPIGLPELREELESSIGSGHPQIIFSLGRATPMRPTPRRPLEDVVLKSS
jgi:hypothetical protein